MNALVATALARWDIAWTVVATVPLAALLYVRGFRELHRQMPNRFGLRQLVAFHSGLAILLLALASPFDGLDDVLLCVHMVQHLLLMLAAAPLIVLGAPAIPLLRGLPKGLTRRVLRPVLKARALRGLVHFLLDPLVCFSVFTLANLGWHLPGPYQLALRSDGWHALEHASFFFGALLFWTPVIQPWPSQARWPRAALVPYLLLGEAENTVLGALFTFSDHLIYPAYVGVPGVAPLSDQALAGILMWVPGSLVFLIPAAGLILSLLGPQALARAPRPAQAGRAAGGGPASLRHSHRRGSLPGA